MTSNPPPLETPNASTSAVPAPRLELPVRRCRECGRTFRASRRDQEFCSDPPNGCRRRHHKKKATRAAAIYDDLILWRMSRGKEGSIGEIARIVDGWITKDREDAERNTARSNA